MPALTAATSLAQIVRAAPGSERTLESFGLDYCCGGARTLADACLELDLDPSVVLRQVVDASEPEPEWASMAPGALVDHLETTHHAYLHAELPRLSALADKVSGVHGARHPELDEIQRAYETIRADLEPHLAKEEQILFPMIRELAAATTTMPRFPCGSLQNPISVMLREHDVVGELLATLRHLSRGYQTPPDGCASYQALFDGLAQLEADTHLHVHKENNLLFPAVVALEADLSR